MFRKYATLFPFAALLAASFPAQAAPETLAIDHNHTFVTFKVSHIGFAWIPGAFTEFSGELSYDPEKPSNSEVTFTVQIPSLETLHAERNKHLESDDYLDADTYPTATFVSTAFEPKGDDKAILRGKLTLHGVTKSVEFRVNELGARKDPWGNFRRAWEAETELKLADFNIRNFNGAVESVHVDIALEATRK